MYCVTSTCSPDLRVAIFEIFRIYNYLCTHICSSSIGEPIWVTAKKHGKRAHTYFWVGSEVGICRLKNWTLRVWRLMLDPLICRRRSWEFGQMNTIILTAVTLLIAELTLCWTGSPVQTVIVPSKFMRTFFCCRLYVYCKKNINISEVAERNW